MKRVIFTVAACALLLLSFVCPAIFNYTTTQGHCSIQFPDKPEESTDTSKSDNGTPFQIHLATYSPTANEVYMLGWINMDGFYPQDKPIQKILEDSRDGATNSLGASEVKTLKTNLSKEPYIEFSFKGPDFIGKDRIYIINKHQYSVITLFGKQTTLPASADKFINSFKHLN